MPTSPLSFIYSRTPLTLIRLGGGCTQFVHSRNRMTTDPRTPTIQIHTGRREAIGTGLGLGLEWNSAWTAPVKSCSLWTEKVALMPTAPI